MTAFDGLTFKQGLTNVRIPDDQAEALSALIRDHVVGNSATKDDVVRTEQRLNDRIGQVEERLRSEIKQLENAMTIKIGSMFIVAVGILLAMQSLLR